MSVSVSAGGEVTSGTVTMQEVTSGRSDLQMKSHHKGTSDQGER